jgi:chromosome segregation ATPase
MSNTLEITSEQLEKLVQRYRLAPVNIAEQAMEFEMLLKQIKAYQERIAECRKEVAKCRESLVTLYSIGTRTIEWRETEPNIGFWFDSDTGERIEFVTLEEAKQLYLNFEIENE